MKVLLSAVLSTFLFLQVPMVSFAHTGTDLEKTELQLLDELKKQNSLSNRFKKGLKVVATVVGGVAVTGLVAGYVTSGDGSGGRKIDDLMAGAKRVGKENSYIYYTFLPFYAGLAAGEAIKADDAARDHINQMYENGKGFGEAAYGAAKRLTEMGYNKAKQVNFKK